MYYLIKSSVSIFFFIVFYFFHLSFSAASSHDIPAEMNMTHCVAMMEWKNEKMIRGSVCKRYSVKLGTPGTSIINDVVCGRMAFGLLDHATETYMQGIDLDAI